MESDDMTTGVNIIENCERTADIHVSEELTFSKFMLSDKLLKTLSKLRLVKPSPIQLKVIPLANAKLDMIIQAKSGTGKTLAFSICLLENYDSELKFPQALVVVPTREIAVQIASVLNDLGRSFIHFRAETVIGGTDVTNDRKTIQSAKIIVGTPGRIYHLIKNDVFNISSLKSVVLDEADKLFESGQMAKDVTSIVKLMPRKIQIIAATATVTTHMENVMKKLMKNPIGITPKHEIPVLLGIKQFVHVLPKQSDNILVMKSKIDELQKIFTRITFKQCLLFTNSQTKTESYGNYLNKIGWKNEVINGAQDQSQRLDVLDKLIKFKCRILITTDLLARGIDIENINLIINLDLPYDCFTYLHRIGRAGRFGSFGIAVSFITGEDELKKFQKMLGDIGGNSLKAMIYPDESTPYDFWSFQDENILDTVSGLDDSKIGQDENLIKKEEETMIKNLTLLEITRKLVDDDIEKECKFDLNAMLHDYEQTSKKLESHKVNMNSSLSKEFSQKEHKKVPQNECDIFQKTIKDLQLYESEGELASTSHSLEEKRHLIFKRINDDIDDGISSEETSSSDAECTNSDSEDQKNCQPTKPKVLRESFVSLKPDLIYNPYSHYVSTSYSQWENIYYYQLANIQNYVKSDKK